MKHPLTLLTLTVCLGVLTLSVAPDAQAAEPDWWTNPDPCDPDWMQCGYWEDGAMTTHGCGGSKGEGGGKDGGGLRDLGDVTVEFNTTQGTVIVRIENLRYVNRIKNVKIRVEGIEATGAPQGVQLEGLPDSGITNNGDDGDFNDPGAGDWWVEAWGDLDPQPNWVVLTFTVPGVDSVEDVKRVWYWECCVSKIPTVSQWGLIVLTLLLLTGGAMVLRRRRAAAA